MVDAELIVESPHHDTFLVYPANLAGKVHEGLFEPEFLRAQSLLSGRAQGRGIAHFFEMEGERYLLRHYYRGGLVAKLVRDRYLWQGLEKTRAYRELEISRGMSNASLPVPRPFAARVIREGLFYRADFISSAIRGANTLTWQLTKGELPEALWGSIGRCLAELHRHGVNHADLNAQNILLDDNDTPHVIDFDRAMLMPAAGAWSQGNLKRLRRSLNKEKCKAEQKQQDFSFSAGNWLSLMAAYDDAISK